MLILFIILLFIMPVEGRDLCLDYVQETRVQHYKYFGVSYPYHFGVGQIKAESACRASARAFDGGMGLSQFMPLTWKEVETDLGVKLNPYNPEHSIKAQAYYMSKLHKSNPDKALWLTYQAYNGGWKLLKQEKERASKYDWFLMKEQCKRKVIPLKSGGFLDLCEVNYNYSIKIYNYAKVYKVISSPSWRYF